MKNVEFKAVGRKDFMGFRWYKCIIDGVEVCQYNASNEEHARKIHNQYSSIKNK